MLYIYLYLFLPTSVSLSLSLYVCTLYEMWLLEKAQSSLTWNSEHALPFTALCVHLFQKINIFQETYDISSQSIYD